MPRTAVLNLVALTRGLLERGRTPRLSAFRGRAVEAALQGLFPAVTCSVQATYLTGELPEEHGIVGNGWYFREECEVKFWRQSNKLVRSPLVWDRAPQLKCANLFWWFNMYSNAQISVTPRPMYPADGRKIPDVYTVPAELRRELQEELGQFPLFHFWGPRASIVSSRWIAASARRVEERAQPDLSLVYLPHLDYILQKEGPEGPNVGEHLGQIDTVAGELIDFYESRGVQVIVLSEYSVTPVSRVVHINRLLRQRGWLAVREELGRELLDAGASRVFAVADHQVAHVYVQDRSLLSQVRSLLEGIPEIASVRTIDHPRAGELVAVARPDAWFSYYYWLEPGREPDFARTVDIHRKPGYDPAELFIDPALSFPWLRVVWWLLRQRLGFRGLLQLTPLDAGLVRGSHGNPQWSDPPVLLASRADLLSCPVLQPTEVCDLLLRSLGQQVPVVS